MTAISISSGMVKTVEILEVDSAALDYSPEGFLIWPSDWPQIEGAMIW